MIRFALLVALFVGAGASAEIFNTNSANRGGWFNTNQSSREWARFNAQNYGSSALPRGGQNNFSGGYYLGRGGNYVGQGTWFTGAPNPLPTRIYRPY